MKSLMTFVLMIGLLVVIGCGDGTESEAQKAIDGAKNRAEKTVDAVSDMGADQIKSFVTDSESKLGEVAKKIVEFEDKTSSLSADVQTAIKEPMKNLKSAHSTALEKVGALKDIDPSKATGVLQEAKKAMENLSGAFDRVKSFF